MRNIRQSALWPAVASAAMLVALLLAWSIAPVMSAASPKAPQAVIRIPGGAHGIGFDDIGYFPSLGKVSIPAGQTGMLVMIDSANGAITNTYQVTAASTAAHAHESGTSSAAYGDGYIFASDHGLPGVVVLNANDGKVLVRIRLGSSPDIIRYQKSRRELWVTEPHDQQIQVFSVIPGPTPAVTLNSDILIAGGPEALVFDTTLNRAYTNLWKAKTIVIDTKTYKQVNVWDDSCEGPRGLALDATKGFLFVACTEGKVAVLDVNHDGKLLATAKAGAGIDLISYNPQSGHLYVPGARSATLTIFKVSDKGALQALAEYRTAKGAHCVTDDSKGTAFVCDPHAGTILEIKD